MDIGGLTNFDLLFPVTLGGLITLIASIWFEFQRADQSNIKLRIVALVAVVISLVAMALKPYIYQEADINTTIVLTEGHQKRDSLRLSYPNSKIIDWSDAILKSELSSHLIVNGFGIPEYDHWKLEGKQVDFVPENLSKGIIDVSYDRETEVGREWQIKLQIKGLSGHALKLEAFGGIVDSVSLLSDGVQELSFTPSSEGRYVFHIQLMDGEGVMTKTYPIPIIIRTSKKLNILILNDQPNFETRFLKNHLKAKGHRLFVRTKITTDKYRYESIGLEIERMPRLKEELLEQFDLILMSTEGLINLPRSQKRVLKNTISNQGTGLLLYGAEYAKLPAWSQYKVVGTEKEEISLTFGEQSETLPINSYFIQPGLLEEAVLGVNNEVVMATKRVGKGKIGIITLSNTYQLSLSGKTDFYSRLWSEIIQSLLKKEDDPWHIPSSFTYAHEPLSFQLVSSVERPEVNYQTMQLPLRQHEFIADRWYGRLWPMKSGWHQLQEKTKKWFYVFEEGDWQEVRQARMLAANKLTFSDTSTSPQKIEMAPSEISLWWFLLLFLLGLGYLWLEPKLK